MPPGKQRISIHSAIVCLQLGYLLTYLVLPSDNSWKRYIKTPMTEQFEDILASQGIKYALSEDACSAMLRIASDLTINGRALAVLPRENVPEGYMDFAQDDASHRTLVRVSEVGLNRRTSHRFGLASLRSMHLVGPRCVS